MKVVVTGAAGDFATAILPLLIADDEISELVCVDLQPPRVEHAKITFEREDVRSTRILELFKGADAVLHLAFVVAEIRDKELTHDVNINGSKNVIHCASDAGVGRLVIASSVTAYGVHDEYVQPLTEDVFPQGEFNKYYYYDKAEVEHYARWWSDQNPKSKLTITLLRPPVVVGPSISNPLVDQLTGPIAVFSKDVMPFQLLHEHDLARAFWAALKSKASGPVNLGTDDSVEIEELAKIHGQKLIRGSLKTLSRLAAISYRLRLSPASDHWITRGGCALSNERARRELKWQPQFTTEEAAYVALIQHGRPILNGQATRVFGRKQVAEAALEASTNSLKQWVGEISGLGRALEGPETIDRYVERGEHAFIPYKGSAIHLEVQRAKAASAPTVVFSPGLGAYARFYLPLVGKLCDAGLNVVAIDRPGHGLSEGSRGDASWKATLDTVEDAVRYAREQFSGPVVLAGSSLGGIITWFSLTRQPDIDAAFCHNIAHPKVLHEPAMKLKVPLLKGLAKLAPHASIPIKQIADFSAASDEPALIEAFESEADKVMAWSACTAAASGMFNYVPPVDWSEVTTPTMIVVGENDRMVTAEFTENVLKAGRPKNLEVKLLPNMGHSIFHDYLDQSAPLLIDFVREAVTPRPGARPSTRPARP